MAIEALRPLVLVIYAVESNIFFFYFRLSTDYVQTSNHLELLSLKLYDHFCRQAELSKLPYADM